MRKVSKSIVVDSDGVIITYTDGKMSSNNPEILERLENAFFFRRVRFVMPFGTEVRPSRDPENIVGIAALMMSVRPGRSSVLEAPPEFWKWFDAEYASFGGGCIPSTSSWDKATLESPPYEYKETSQSADLEFHTVDDLLEGLLDEEISSNDKEV